MTVCNIPPAGWHCTRKAGHDGPCAAWPDAPERPSVGIAAGDAPNPSRPTTEDVARVIDPDGFAEWGNAAFGDLTPAATKALGFRVHAALEKAQRILDLLPTGEGWRPKETLPHPKDAGLFFAAIKTEGINSPLKWEVHLICLDDETHDVHANYDHGWRWEDYSFWQPGPAFPPAPSIAGEGR